MTLLTMIAMAAGTDAFAAGRQRAVARSVPAIVTSATCAGEALPASCRDGGAAFAPLAAAEVERLARGAAAAIDEPRMTVAIVDRAGRVLALFRNPGADPANDDKAVGIARTAAFFSHDMAPLSSRTVRFISGVHFPPGVRRAGAAALYGIENTNRGCDFNITFNAGKCLPRATSLGGGRCDAFDTSGCGTGPVTGKTDMHDGHAGGDHPPAIGLRGPENPGGVPVEPGGIPIYRVANVSVASGSLDNGDARVEATGPGSMLGGIGVTGTSSPEAAEFAAFAAVAFAGGNLFPAPQFPLPAPGAVYIDGIRLPFVEQGIRPAGASAGSAAGGTFVVGPARGGCAPNRYLAGPSATPELSADEVDAIVRRTVEAAQQTRGAIRLPLNSYARMVIAIADLDGNIAALYRMPDATVFSIDVAVAKARNVVWFSGAGAADLPGIPLSSITNRTIGYGAQPLFPSGIDGTDPGPLFDLFVRDLANPCSQGSQPANANQNGIVFFPGSLPLYRNGVLIGGLGVSGDGVEQDDWVSWRGAEGFRPPQELWPDRVTLRGTRMPILKFPRQAGGVTEEVSEPFDEP
ncbi:MAG TPA: heme-binding protein [Thermoanaerobaculia bacterium]|nr:heme-binding protein [Thermoanaerobaculia bacterium]